MRSIYIIIKRLLDLILSMALIVLLSPLFVIVAISIKLDSPGPVLYKQKRTGLGGEEFTLLKFRSMASDNDVYDFKTGDKITKVGKFIRKTSLDELPQLMNIIKGDMSFIGPRPWLPILDEYYTDYQKRRFLVRPGITGLAQISGRKDLNILNRIDLDIKYVNNLSLLTDIKIILKTLSVIINSSDNTRDNYTIEDELRDLKVNFYNCATEGKCNEK